MSDIADIAALIPHYFSIFVLDRGAGLPSNNYFSTLRHFTLLCFVILGSLVVNIKAQDIKQITPLESNRGDVESILGKSVSGDDCWSCLYKKDTQNISIIYSAGSCEAGDIWRVPKDTVLRVTVYLTQKVKLSALGIKKARFSIKEDPELPNIFHYVNEKEGVNITVDGGYVTTIIYSPSENQSINFRCEKEYSYLVTYFSKSSIIFRSIEIIPSLSTGLLNLRASLKSPLCG